MQQHNLNKVKSSQNSSAKHDVVNTDSQKHSYPSKDNLTEQNNQNSQNTHDSIKDKSLNIKQSSHNTNDEPSHTSPASLHNSEPLHAQAELIMSKNSNAQNKKSSKISLVWIVPILAIILTALLLWENTFNKGSEIKIYTNSAEGIEAGKTLVKLRSVPIGMVTSVELSANYKNAVLTVQMYKNTDDLLRKDSSFWIVRPRIENTGISGLDTLLSGSYIQLNIGKSTEMTKEFKALQDPPVRLGSEDGLMLKLFTHNNKRISKGDNILFKGFEVGTVVDTEFNIEKQHVIYTVFIRDPFAKFVSTRSKFWVSSGLDVKLTSSGLAVNTESLDNLIIGSISFDNFVDHINLSNNVVDNTEYLLYKDRESARLASLENGLIYVVMLENDIFNITPGSAITFNGIKIGEVVKAPWYDGIIDVLENKTVPVLISIISDSSNQAQIRQIFNSYLQNKQICASVGSDNLIISNNRLDLSLATEDNKCSTALINLAKGRIEEKNGLVLYNEIPVIPLVKQQSLASQFDDFMQKLNKFDVEGFSTEIQNSLKAFAQAMNAFTESNKSVKDSNVINRLSQAFYNFNNSVKGYGPDTDLYKSIQDNLKNIEQILQDLSPAVTAVGQEPSSILFGTPKDPIPRVNKEKQNSVPK